MFATTLGQAVQGPAGSGMRRNAWFVAGAGPLAVGLTAAALQPVVGYETLLSSLNGSVLVLMLGVASLTDSVWRKIPNWITYSAFLWAMALNLLATFSLNVQASPADAALFAPIGIGNSLFGAAACFAAMFALFQLAGSGAGDVKIAAAIGALLGTGPGLTAILWCHIFAGITMLAWLIWSQGPLTIGKTFLIHIGSVLLPNHVPAPTAGAKRVLQRPVPMAAFFAIGVIVTMIQGPLL